VTNPYDGKPLLQVWEREVEGRRHRVELYGPNARRIRWLVDGNDVGHRTTVGEKETLTAAGVGRLVVRMSFLGAPRRASVTPEGSTTLGGVDLVPEPGSKAEQYAERMLAHPRLHTARETLGAAGGVLLPLLLAFVVSRIAVAVPWPDIPWPDIPWPDIPSIPWPALPSIPWPDLPAPPAWVREALHAARYVAPVVVAYVVARLEITRRRRLRAERATQDGDVSGTGRK